MGGKLWKLGKERQILPKSSLRWTMKLGHSKINEKAVDEIRTQSSIIHPQCSCTTDNQEKEQQDEDHQENNFRKLNEELKTKLQKARNDCGELQGIVTAKDKEITTLKDQVSGYIQRLENVLGDSSQIRKDKIHLAENLESLKKANIALTLEISKKDDKRNKQNINRKQMMK